MIAYRFGARIRKLTIVSTHGAAGFVEHYFGRVRRMEQI